MSSSAKSKAKAKGVVVKRGAPNWPAQVKVKAAAPADEKRDAKPPQLIQWVERTPAKEDKDAKPDAAARYLGHGRAAAAEQIRNDLSRPPTRGFVMRQCKICKVLFEGYHNCDSDDWLGGDFAFGEDGEEGGDEDEGPAWYVAHQTQGQGMGQTQGQMRGRGYG